MRVPFISKNIFVVGLFDYFYILSEIEDKHHQKFKDLAKKLEISFDAIHHTNFLEVLSLSDDPRQIENAINYTAENFKIASVFYSTYMHTYVIKSILNFNFCFSCAKNQTFSIFHPFLWPWF